jgi:hypothetical protein
MAFVSFERVFHPLVLGVLEMMPEREESAGIARMRAA